MTGKAIAYDLQQCHIGQAIQCIPYVLSMRQCYPERDHHHQRISMHNVSGHRVRNDNVLLNLLEVLLFMWRHGG